MAKRTLAQTVRYWAARFAPLTEVPLLEARLLVCAALDLEDAAYLSAQHTPLDLDREERIASLCQRREQAEPIAYILGRKDFFGRAFVVGPGALIPRPETERLIEVALEKLDAGKRSQSELRLLDVGTGPGTLLLTLLCEYPLARGLGTDISEAALRYARVNCGALGAGDRSLFVRTMWHEGVRGPFDLIVSNPPYIESGVLETLMPDVRLYEPHRALDGGADGLAPYRALFASLQAVLRPGGWAIFEFGIGQRQPLETYAEMFGWHDVSVYDDLSGRPRCLALQAPDKR